MALTDATASSRNGAHPAPTDSHDAPSSARAAEGATVSLDGMATLDLSWTQAFHTVSLSRWSEPPGPGGFPCHTWRVLVGAFGRYVSSNHTDLGAAIAQVLERAAEDPILRDLLGAPREPDSTPPRP